MTENPSRLRVARNALRKRLTPTFDAASDTGLTTSSLTALAAASAFSMPVGNQMIGIVRNLASDGGESVLFQSWEVEDLGIAFTIKVRRAASGKKASDPLRSARTSEARLTSSEGVANLVVDVFADGRSGVQSPARSSDAEGSDGSAVHLLQVFPC